MPHRKDLRHRVEMRIDGYSQICLTIIVGLLALLVAGLWSQGAYSARAGAQSKPLTNPTSQRQKLIDAQEKTNQKLGQLIQLLEKGDAKIQVIAPRKDKSGGENGNNSQ
jgi:hypothetical protein